MLKLWISAIELKFGTILNAELFRASEKFMVENDEKMKSPDLSPVIPDHDGDSSAAFKTLKTMI